MNMTDLPPSEKRRGQRNYSLFQGLNTFAFILLSGDFIVLYLLKLGASSSLIGLTSSFKQLSFLLMFIGRRLIPHTGTRRLMGTCWLIRYLIMTAALFSPVLTMNGRVREGILLTVLAVLASQIFRGIGIVGFKPVIGAITDSRDRGDFLSRLEIITYIITITIGIVSALLIGREASLFRYIIFLGGGIVMGVLASVVLFHLPEPPSQETLARTGMFRGIGKALKRPGFGYFIAVLCLTSFCLGATTPFIVVYAKREYLQTDAIVLFLTVAGGLGAVAMGLITRKVIDRLGAKPMFILFNGLLAISIVPMIVSPGFSPLPLVVFLAVLFFMFQMGFAGSQNAAQNYFFAVVEPSEHLNLGIFFNIVSGMGNAAGALAGGFLLDRIGSFRVYWSIALAVTLLSVLLSGRLKRVGKYSVMDSLSILFSPRDMKAVSLLKRLDKSTTTGEEVKAIKALAENPSEVAVDDLLAELKNPRFYIRSQALVALEHLPFDGRLEEALRTEVKNHEFTTAYMAARILGKKGSPRNRRILRRALHSSDYLLQANAALALGRLGDRASIPALEALLLESGNPMVIILSASALELMKSTSSLGHLMTAFRRENPPPFLRDEIVLAASGILDMEEWFYPFYTVFLEKAGTGFDYLTDYYRSAPGKKGKVDVSMDHLVLRVLTMNRNEFTSVASVIFHIFRDRDLVSPEILRPLSAAVDDPELMKYDRLLFFIAAFIVRTVVLGV